MSLKTCLQPSFRGEGKAIDLMRNEYCYVTGVQLVVEHLDLVFVHEGACDGVEKELSDVFKARGSFGFSGFCLEVSRGIQSCVGALGDEAETESDRGKYLHFLLSKGNRKSLWTGRDLK